MEDLYEDMHNFVDFKKDDEDDDVCSCEEKKLN